MLFSSSAIKNPKMVTVNAVSFRYSGMVIWGTVIGKILFEIMNPAKILPISRRLIGFIRRGLFSLIKINVENRGCPSRAKNIMRVL